jgi:glycosyltransferase involved in cell wall biosynthesis
LESLLIPSIDAVEVLVVNDGSKDSSSAIAHEYAAMYPKSIVVIDKENGNYGSCINRGLKAATGKYIKVLDADDSFDTENFEQYVQLLKTVNVDMLLTDYVIVNEQGDVKSNTTFQIP